MEYIYKLLERSVENNKPWLFNLIKILDGARRAHAVYDEDKQLLRSIMLSGNKKLLKLVPRWYKLDKEDAITMVHSAILYGKLESLKYMIEEYKVSLDDYEEWAREPILHTVVTMGWGEKIEIMKYLISKGADPMAKADQRNIASLLHRAISSGCSLEEIDYVCGLGIDVNEVDENGYSALHYYKYSTSAEAMDRVRNLLDIINKHGGKIDIENSQGLTPLGTIYTNESFVRRYKDSVKELANIYISRGYDIDKEIIRNWRFIEYIDRPSKKNIAMAIMLGGSEAASCIRAIEENTPDPRSRARETEEDMEL